MSHLSLINLNVLELLKEISCKKTSIKYLLKSVHWFTKYFGNRQTNAHRPRQKTTIHLSPSNYWFITEQITKHPVILNRATLLFYYVLEPNILIFLLNGFIKLYFYYLKVVYDNATETFASTSNRQNIVREKCGFF